MGVPLFHFAKNKSQTLGCRNTMGANHGIYTNRPLCKQKCPDKLYTSKMMIESDFISPGLEDPQSPCQDRMSLEPGPKSTGRTGCPVGFSLFDHPDRSAQSPPRPLQDQVNATPFT